ncbi:MAG: NAD(P)/FAD-dependent oxidoreductase [Planctomycetales bacterium]|nr:NAD(P)/FAD-dependent oxidoreductase [Planctomycetales bacterium]
MIDAADRLRELDSRPEPWDVAIIGAGPAGATLAALMATRGRRVILLDRQTFPRDKVCGGCLNRRGQLQLAACGLDRALRQAQPVELQRLHLRHALHHVDVCLEDMCAIARDVFDAQLVSLAVEHGAQFLSGVRVRVVPDPQRHVLRTVELLTTHDQPSGQPSPLPVAIESRIVVAACGLTHHGTFADSELSQVVRATSRIGLGARIRTTDAVCTEMSSRFAPHALTMAIGRDGYVGAVRLTDGSLNLAAAATPTALRTYGAEMWVRGTLRSVGLDMPEAAELAWRGTAPLTRHCEHPVGHRLIAIGDAAGYVEPFTGEGMGWAIDSAIIAADWVDRGLQAWTPALEQRCCEQLKLTLAKRQQACRLIAHLLSRPWAVRLSLATLAACPPLTRSLVRHFSSSAA